MKKLIILLLIATFLVFVSCDPEQPIKPVITDFSLSAGNTTYDGTIAVSIVDDGTAVAWMVTFTSHRSQGG